MATQTLELLREDPGAVSLQIVTIVVFRMT